MRARPNVSSIDECFKGILKVSKHENVEKLKESIRDWYSKEHSNEIINAELLLNYYKVVNK